MTARAPTRDQLFAIFKNQLLVRSFEELFEAGAQFQPSYQTGALLVGGTAGIVSDIPDVAVGSVLLSQGTGIQPAYGKVDLTAAVVGVLPLANGGVVVATLPEVQAGTDNTKTVTPSTLQNGKVIPGAYTALSGTATSLISGLPSWVRMVVVNIVNMSTSGTSVPILQFGPSGGVETSSYNGASTTTGTASTTTQWSSGAIVSENHSAALVLSGTVTMTLADPATNTWAVSVSVSRVGSSATNVGSGAKALAGPIDQVSLAVTGGVQTFDGGSASVLYL